MKLIGVSACFLYPDTSRVVHGPKTLMYYEQDMCRYLSRKNVLTTLLPSVSDRSYLRDYIALCAGIVFQGGSDMAPESYGQTPIGKWTGDPYRDEYELFIFDEAMRQKKPIFAICRGVQLMNVYFGGTLFQDIETQCKGAIQHRDADLYDTCAHKITLIGNAKLGRIYQCEFGTVNSVHHQAIDALGNNLTIEAVSTSDQIIEAISLANTEQFVLGVQWHPEFAHTIGEAHLDPHMLYQAFLNEVEHQ